MKINILWIGIISLVAIIVYIFLMNTIALYLFEEPAITENQSKTEITEGGAVEIDVGNNIDISVKRNRWYGHYEFFAGKKKSIEHLYLFGFIKLPIQVNKTRFVIYHIIIGSLLVMEMIVIGIYEIIKKINRRFEDEELA